MSNAFTTNLTLITSDERFHAIWKLTRTLLAAGFRYKASSDIAVKETTGSPDLDRWAVSGFTNLATVSGQTGSTATFTALATHEITLTGLTGMTSSSVGRALAISGAASAGNIGTFRISAFISSSSVKVFNPAGVVADANNGSIAWIEQYGAAAASVASVANNIATLTGLTGMVSPTASSPGSTGHTLTISGAASGGNNGTFQIASVISATSVTIINPSAVAGDANNGSIVWIENDPLLQVYPASLAAAAGTGAWQVLQGPSTLKITIGSNVPSTDFRRGEKVTQAGTSAEGEIMGVVTDAAGGGYLVIAPRVNGNGGGAKGWSTSGVISAQSAPTGTGASVTPTGVIEFIREFVWWKSSATAGHLYYQCIDTTTESSTTPVTGRFSTMAALATATLTICPGGATGGSPVTNGFPTIGTLTVMGTGGSGSVGTGSYPWISSNLSNTTGKMQIMVANAIEAAGVSPDGSWTLAVGVPATSPNVFTGICWTRLDDTEDGDVDPYVFFIPPSGSNYTRPRTVKTSALSSADFWNLGFMALANYTPYFGFRRRGFYSGNIENGDTYQEFQGLGMAFYSATAMPAQANAADVEKVACAYTNVRVREPLFIASIQVGQKMRKGSTRWLYYLQGGNGTDTYDSKRWVQLSTSTTANPPVVAGPWDQSTTPTNS